MAPKKPVMILRGATKACPVCGERGLFTRWFSLAERCPRCGLKFERIEGHWVGAIGMNTIVSFVLILFALIGAVLLTAPDYPLWALGVVMLLGLAFPAFFDPISRTLWTGIDLAMRPLEAHEVDWTVVQERNPTNDPEL